MIEQYFVFLIVASALFLTFGIMGAFAESRLMDSLIGIARSADPSRWNEYGGGSDATAANALANDEMVYLVYNHEQRTIFIEDGEAITIDECRSLFDRALVADCNSALTALVNFDYDMEALERSYAIGRVTKRLEDHRSNRTNYGQYRESTRQY